MYQKVQKFSSPRLKSQSPVPMAACGLKSQVQNQKSGSFFITCQLIMTSSQSSKHYTYLPPLSTWHTSVFSMISPWCQSFPRTPPAPSMMTSNSAGDGKCSTHVLVQVLRHKLENKFHINNQVCIIIVKWRFFVESLELVRGRNTDF